MSYPLKIMDIIPASFPSTDGSTVIIHKLKGLSVIFIFPSISDSEKVLPKEWLSIPGAGGCTAQACSFRDHYPELLKQHVNIFGLSSQSVKEQKKAKNMHRLPFELLSDTTFYLKNRLGLPTFQTRGAEYYKRLTFIAEKGHIRKVLYPVPNPEMNVHDVIDWLTLKTT